MHKLSKRSASAILRSGGARFRDAAAPVSTFNLSNDSTGEIHTKPRWYSVLTAGRCSGSVYTKHSNLRNEQFLGNRYESTAAASESSDSPAVKYEYQAEVSRLMDLIVNSLYSNKEVFLRELISNASDALDKLRFLSVTDSELIKDAVDLDIRIHTDKDNGIVTITDSGIGMTRQELVDCLGTIAQSGTAKFLKTLKDNKDAGADSNLIGQFGVGFYSAFLVSDRVVVSTKSPKSDKQYVWEGEVNSSSYTIREETDPEKLIPRGTRLTLYLKRDEKGFAHPERIQKLVKNYSQFVSFPIYTWQEKGYTKEVEVDEDPAEVKKDEQDANADEKKKKKKTKTVVEKYWDWELTNETQPIWLRNPKEVSTDDYNEFYKKAFNEYLEPLASSHFTTEGEVEFRSILYVPSIAPMGKEDIVNPKTKNIRLYVKRVFISDDFDGELFPRYLSFVKGVVDSNDLPLNVSREILQESRIVRIMRKRLVRKTFEMIKRLSDSENREDYEKFWENFGKHLKLGCIEDRENHKRLAPLLRFFSSQSEEDMISLDEYVQNMKADQKDIYYIATDSVTSAKNTPFLEKLLEKDLEVLFLVDPIDEVAVTNLKSYNEKNFVDISKEDLDLGDKNEEKEKEIKQEFGQTCDWIKKRVGDKVTRVQISSRLSTSPCVLVSGKFGWSANMERLMKAQAVGDTASLEFMRGRRVFEINPEHPIIRTLDTAYRNSPNDEEALRAIDLLYDTTLVFSGFTPDSPAQLGWKIYEMVGMALTVLPAIMYKLSKRFVSVILRNGGARFHDAAAHVSTFNTFNDSTGEIDTKPRWYLVLTVGKCSGSVSTTHRNLRHEQCLGNRYESTAAASESSDSPAMKYEYQAEVNRLINLKVNSLYSKKEVFLRELISNASDALDKLRFLRVTDSELIKGAVDLDIRIHTDKDKGIVTTTDSGFGMTHQELVDCLGTITQSGTTKFLKALKYSKAAGADSTLIGQFVVGFYSSFLVCDRVIVSTKSPKSDKQYEWEGEVNSSFYSIREETLKELVMLPLQRLELFCKGQLTKPCKGILSFGPPGTGQTMIAKAVATETGANFIIISMSSITSKWLGEGEKYVKAVFTLASKVAPSVVVVDEVDSMLGQRENPGEHGAMLKMKNEYDFGYCTTPLVFDPGGVLEFLQIFANHG